MANRRRMSSGVQRARVPRLLFFSIVSTTVRQGANEIQSGISFRHAHHWQKTANVPQHTHMMHSRKIVFALISIGLQSGIAVTVGPG